MCNNEEDSKNISEISNFEKHHKSIGYVVAKYSMGYDFRRLDFICITDPKMSYPDIIQSIGRGMRILNNNEIKLGYVKEKCKILLPVYLEVDEKTKYERVKKVLEYLVCDIDLKYIEIFKKYQPGKKTSPSKMLVEDVEGLENIMSKVYDILYHKWKMDTFVEHLRENEIYDLEMYNKYYELKNTKKLKLPPYPHELFPKFNWKTINIGEKSVYYERDMCIIKIKKIIRNNDIFDNFEDEDDKHEYLHKMNNKIPNTKCLWKFYGGSKKEFMF